MDLAIDVVGNRLTVDGIEVAGRHRWEAALLALLANGQHVGATTACGAPILHAELAALGQVRPLNRKQLSRLWHGLQAMFAGAGEPDALACRLGHPPRSRTVGPWWWASQLGDSVRIVQSPATSRRQFELPTIASGAVPEEAASLCRHLLVCQGAFVDGRLDEATTGFADDDAWRLASTEFHAFRWLRAAEAHMQARAFEAARAALRRCQGLIGGSEVAAQYLGGAARLLEHRLAYHERPTECYAAVAGVLAPLVHRAPGTRFAEADRFTRGLMFNLSGLCARRGLEDQAQRAEARSAHLDAALRYWYAALFCFTTTDQYEYVQNMCSNIAYLLQRAIVMALDVRPRAALEWYAVAQVWQNRFDLADNNVWEYIFLGDFWLDVARAREEFDELSSRVAWRGLRPDSLRFYEHALARAKEIGEPRQVAHTALNLWRFACSCAQPACAATASGELRRVLSAHPDVRTILKSEGYALP